MSPNQLRMLEQSTDLDLQLLSLVCN